MNRDPVWRGVAYWGVVASFFTLPLVVFAFHITGILQHWDDPHKHLGEFKYVFEFHKVLAAILISMLGLNSWDKRLDVQTSPAPQQQEAQSNKKKSERTELQSLDVR